MMRITKEQIINAAINILNRDGIDCLTMRALANEMNIKAASIYWHIKDKNELYGLIAENICEQVKMSASLNEPKKYLYELNTKYRAKLLEIKNAVEIFLCSAPITPCRSNMLGNTLNCLSMLGVKGENCLTAANMLNSYVLSFVAEEIRLKSGAANITPGEGKFSGASKSLFYYEAQFLYGLEVLFAGFRAISPSN